MDPADRAMFRDTILELAHSLEGRGRAGAYHAQLLREAMADVLNAPRRRRPVTWLDSARAAIVIALAKGWRMGLEGKALERHVSEAYPFGERSLYPYKCWLSEVALLVRGERPKPARRRAKGGPRPAGEFPMTEQQREFFMGD